MSDEEQKQSPQEQDKELEFNSMLNELNEEDKAFVKEELRLAEEKEKINTTETQTPVDELRQDPNQVTNVVDMMKYQFNEEMRLARERGHVMPTEDGKIREAPTEQDAHDGIQSGFQNTAYGQEMKKKLHQAMEIAAEASKQEQREKRIKETRKKKLGNFISGIIITFIIIAAAIYFISK